MLTSLWAAKGGAGCSTVALLAASARARAGSDVLVVDLGGDLLTMIAGVGASPPGITDWLASTADVDRLDRVEVEVTTGVWIAPLGRASSWTADREGLLAAALDADARDVVVDVGLVDPALGGSLQRLRHRFASSEGGILVTRPCYLAVHRATRTGVAPRAALVVREPGRALDDRMIAEALGLRRLGHLDLDPAVARSVDAGLIVRRPPRTAVRQVAKAVS